jgi:hypothetical protein
MAKKLFLDYFCPKNTFEDWLEPLTHLEDHDLEPIDTFSGPQSGAIDTVGGSQFLSDL